MMVISEVTNEVYAERLLLAADLALGSIDDAVEVREVQKRKKKCVVCYELGTIRLIRPGLLLAHLIQIVVLQNH